MGSKGSNATTTQTNSSQSWSADPAARAAYLRLMGRAEDVASTPYAAYTGQQVADFTPFQQQAFNATQAAQGAYQPYIQQGFGAAQQALMPSYQSVNAYMSPYTQNVVDATRANFAESNAQAQQQVIGNAALKGALGGDRVGVAQAELARQQKLAQDPVIANLYNQGYTSALGAAQTDANRALSAGNLYGSLAQTGQGLNYGDINALYGMGSQQQQLNQALLNVPYQQFLEQRAFPYQQTQWLAGLTTGVGSQLGGRSTGTSTQTQTPPQPNPWNALLGGGLALASLPMTGGASAPTVAGWGLSSLFGAATGGRIPRAQGGIAIPYTGGRIPRAEGGITVPYSGGYIPQVGLAAKPMQPPPMMQAPAPAAARPDNSAAGLIKQATDLAGHIRGSLRSQPMNINPAGVFSPTPVGQIARSTYDANAPIGPGLGSAGYIYARGGKVLDMERDSRGIYVPRRGYQDGGPTFNDAWNDRVFEPSQDAAWRTKDNTPGLAAGLARPYVSPAPEQIASADDDVPPVIRSASPGTGSIVPMGYAPEPSISGAPSGLGGPGLGGAGLGAAGAAPQPQPQRGGGLFNLSDEARQGLLTAGLGIMASKSPFLGQAVGEGGLAGVGVYREAMKLKEAAERARQSLAETSRHHRASEEVARDRLDQENWQYIGTNEGGLPIYMDRRSGEERVGKTKTVGRPGSGRGSGGVSQWRYETYLRNHPNDTAGAEAYAVGKKQIGDAQLLQWARRDAKAEVSAQLVPPRDVAAQTDKRAQELYEQYRRANGAGAPPASPAAAAPPTSNITPAPAARPIAKPDQDAVIAKAREAIAKGAPRDQVAKRLQENGYDTSGLDAARADGGRVGYQDGGDVEPWSDPMNPGEAGYVRSARPVAETAGAVVGGLNDRARAIMKASDERLAGGDYNPAPVVEAAKDAYLTAAGGPMAKSFSPAGQALARAAAAMPKTSAATAAGLGYLTMPGIANEATPSGDPLGTVDIPPRPREPEPYVIPEMPDDIKKMGPRRRDAWIKEQQQIKKDADATNAENYSQKLKDWTSLVDQVKTDTAKRIASEQTRKSNLPMREQYPLAFNALTYGPSLLAGYRANAEAGALRAAAAERRAAGAAREQVAEAAAKKAWENDVARYQALKDAIAERAKAGKGPLKAQTAALASPPPAQYSYTPGPEPRPAGKPWRTIGEGAVGSGLAPMIPYGFDYQRIAPGEKGREDAERALFSWDETPKRLGLGAAEGLVAGVVGSELPSFPRFRFRGR